MASDTRSRPTGEINPYAAPQVGDAARPFADAGIGVWRDGSLLVMHKQAELPRYCIHTGEEAVGSIAYELVWHARGRVFARSAKLQIPLCQRCLDQATRLRAQSRLGLVLTALAGIGFLGAPALVLGNVDARLMIPIVGLGFAGMGLWLHAYWAFGKPLSVVHAEGAYLWLRDAHRDFLNRLPEWPYGK